LFVMKIDRISEAYLILPSGRLELEPQLQDKCNYGCC